MITCCDYFKMLFFEYILRLNVLISDFCLLSVSYEWSIALSPIAAIFLLSKILSNQSYSCMHIFSSKGKDLCEKLIWKSQRSPSAGVSGDLCALGPHQVLERPRAVTVTLTVGHFELIAEGHQPASKHGDELFGVLPAAHVVVNLKNISQINHYHAAPTIIKVHDSKKIL